MTPVTQNLPFAQVDIDSHDVGAFDEVAAENVQKVADYLADAYQTREKVYE